MAIDQLEVDPCSAAIEAADVFVISAGTIPEALIVSARRKVGEEEHFDPWAWF